MAWFKVDDGFGSSPKVMAIPRSHRLACMGLWVMAGTWSARHLTDGRIPEFMLEEWGANVSQGDMLVTSGLWKRDGDGYVFHDWSDYQPTRADTLATRERERRRKEDWRAKNRANKGQSPSGTQSPKDDASEHPDPTRPDPTHIEESKDSSKARATVLPKSWEPTNDHKSLAANRGLDINYEADQFRLHAETHDRRAVRWNAAFTMWLKKATPTRKPKADPDWWMRQ